MLQILKYSVLFVLIINNFVTAYPKDSGDESQEVKPAVYDNYRLPTSITPENYKLEIFTHLNDSEGFTFRGIVEITVSTIFV
jgi:hypothetical protein